MEVFDGVICKVFIVGMIVLVATDYFSTPNHRLFSKPTTGEGMTTEKNCQTSEYTPYTPPAVLNLPSRREPGGTR